MLNGIKFLSIAKHRYSVQSIFPLMRTARMIFTFGTEMEHILANPMITRVGKSVSTLQCIAKQMDSFLLRQK